MTAPIIVPDDDSTRHALDDAILRATGYSPVTADVILRALRLHSDAHGVGAATIDALWQRLQGCEADRDFDRAQHARKLAQTRAHADAMLRLYVRTAETHDLIATRVVEAYMARRKTARLADLAAAAAIVEVRATTANAPHLRDLANRMRALAETLNPNSTPRETPDA